MKNVCRCVEKILFVRVRCVFSYDLCDCRMRFDKKKNMMLFFLLLFFLFCQMTQSHQTADRLVIRPTERLSCASINLCVFVYFFAEFLTMSNKISEKKSDREEKQPNRSLIFVYFLADSSLRFRVNFEVKSLFFPIQACSMFHSFLIITIRNQFNYLPWVIKENYKVNE